MTARFSSIPGGDSAAMRARNPALYGAPADATPRDAPAEPCTDTPKKRKRRSVAHSNPDGTLGDEPDKAQRWRAASWRDLHRAHVDRLLVEAHGAFPPSAEDARDPRLWKPEHWAWFVQRIGEVPVKPQTNGEKNRRIREYGVPRGEFITSMLNATKEGE